MRRVLFLFVLCPVSAWAAQPSVVETLTKTATVSNETIGPMTIGAGNGYCVGVMQTSGARTIDSVTSDVDGALTGIGTFNAGVGRNVGMWCKFASAGGSVTVTIDQSGTFIAYEGVLFEFTCPSGTCSLDTAGSDGFMNTAVTTHLMAPSGELDTSADVLWVGVCMASANLGVRTPTTGFETDTTNLTTSGFWQYEDDQSSAFTDQRGSWTSGTARDTYCRAYAIKNTASSSGSSKGGRLLRKGVG